MRASVPIDRAVVVDKGDEEALVVSLSLSLSLYTHTHTLSLSLSLSLSLLSLSKQAKKRRTQAPMPTLPRIPSRAPPPQRRRYVLQDSVCLSNVFSYDLYTVFYSYDFDFFV